MRLSDPSCQTYEETPEALTEDHAIATTQSYQCRLRKLAPLRREPKRGPSELPANPLAVGATRMIGMYRGRLERLHTMNHRVLRSGYHIAPANPMKARTRWIQANRPSTSLAWVNFALAVIGTRMRLVDCSTAVMCPRTDGILAGIASVTQRQRRGQCGFIRNARSAPKHTGKRASSVTRLS